MDNFYLIVPAGILLTPLLAFAIILFFGRWLDKLADKLAIMAMLVSFVLSAALFACCINDRGVTAPSNPIVTSFSWIKLGGIDLQMGFLVDNLSSFMCMIVTGLATLVLIYSIFYMDGDTMYRRYF